MPNNTNHQLATELVPEQDTLRVENEALKKGFTLIPNYILRARGISRDAKLLYGILLSYAWQQGSCFPGYETLMEDMQCAREALVKYIKELRASGLIEVKRRGQGKTSIYTIKDLVGQGEPEIQKFENRTSRSSETKQQGVRKSNAEEYSVQEDPEEKIYPSKIRTAKKENGDYVNSSPAGSGAVRTQAKTEETEQLLRGRPPQTQETGSEERQRPSKNRKIEELQRTDAQPPAREEIHNPKPRSSPAGVASVGELLRHQPLPKAIPDDEAHTAIRDFVRDMAGKNHDEASLKSSTTRAYNLYLRTGVSLGYFFNLVYEADKEANSRSTTIKKRTADGFTNRMAYFFAVLEDRLGLREKPSARRPHSS